MYTPHTVTIYNARENPTTLAMEYNVTILTGVLIDIAKGARTVKSGLSDIDSTTIYIPMAVLATDGTTGAVKQYITPKAYDALADRSAYWTLNPGGAASGASSYIVKGAVVRSGSNASFKALKESEDFVFDITAVDIRDFGSADMHHWQVSAR